MTDDSWSEHEAPSGKRRELVLAAYRRIARGGFEGLRTRDVAGDVGVNIGTLHYYFPSKEALIRAVVRHTTASFAATLAGKGTPAEQLRGHLEGLRKLLKRDPELFAVSNEIALRSVRDPDIGELMRQADEQWFGFLRALVARGVAQGCLDRQLHPDGVAAVMVASIKGLSMPAGGAPRPERVDQTIDQLEAWLGLAAEPRSVEPEEC